MTVVLEAEASPLAPAIPQGESHDEAAEAPEEIIAAHRAALRELAPHQAARWVRQETAWHIAHLGLLLRLRDSGGGAMSPHPSLAALRAGQAARVQAAMAYREAGGDPVEEITTLLPRSADAIAREEHKAPAGVVPHPRGPRENTGPERCTR